MTYLEMKKKHQQRFNDFPMAFAFSVEQLEEGLKKLGLTKADKHKVIPIGSGGFIRKKDKQAFLDMIEETDKEMKQLIHTDDEFAYEMFKYELGNHEYCITYDYEDTLEACGLTYKEVQEDERLNKILETAKNDYLKSMDCY